MSASDLDFDSLEALRRMHPAWRLLAADHAPFVLAFLYRTFVEPNHRSLPEHEIMAKLEDFLFRLRERRGIEAYKRQAKEYLDEWTSDERAWLRRFYPPSGDEPHFDLTPATEKAVEWVRGLSEKQFVGTESRLMTIFDLLRQLAIGTQTDPQARIGDLEKRRDALEAEIAEIRAGKMTQMDSTQVKERFFQMSATARGLLTDFREVEQNFRKLDRTVRDSIAAWEGGKGELLQDVFGESDAIRDSDQGRSFQAFWDFLMSQARQEELTQLLDTVLELDPVRELKPDPKLRKIHFDWLQAGDLTQRTIARLSGQLRRYLDDQAALENRRIMQILRGIEQHAIALRKRPPVGDCMAMDDFAPSLDMSMDRRLYSPPLKPVIEGGQLALGESNFASDALYEREYVDKEVLKGRIRKMLQMRNQISLEDLVEAYPLEHGLAELVTYLSLAADDKTAIIDDSQKCQLNWQDSAGVSRQAIMPRVLFQR